MMWHGKKYHKVRYNSLFCHYDYDYFHPAKGTKSHRLYPGKIYNYCHAHIIPLKTVHKINKEQLSNTSNIGPNSGNLKLISVHNKCFESRNFRPAFAHRFSIQKLENS